LVTGAGRRVGRAIAGGLAQAGCDVAVHYHGSGAGADATAREIRALGRRAELVTADLRDPAAARRLADQAAAALGGLDVLVNSAAIMVQQRVEDVTPESWDATFDLNLRAYFFVAQGAIPHLRASRGRIVNMADEAAFEPWPQYVPHCVSKAGVVMLTKGLARALAPEITVTRWRRAPCCSPRPGTPPPASTSRKPRRSSGSAAPRTSCAPCAICSRAATTSPARRWSWTAGG